MAAGYYCYSYLFDMPVISKRTIKQFVWSIQPGLDKELVIGLITGTVLMLTPAIFLMLYWLYNWQINTVGLSSVLQITSTFIAVALAEEVLFRGFIFQRLIAGLGEPFAQLLIAGYFLLIHLNNPGMTGSIKLIASVNIFLASIIFGLAFIRTKGLAMPIGIHFMANWIQGAVLGFGVSGHEQAGLLRVEFNGAPDWLTGGSFGLETSIPGLISVIFTIFLLYTWKRSNYISYA